MTLPPSSCDRLSLMFTTELKNLRETLRKFYELYIGFLVILSSNTLIFHYNQDQLCHELSSLPHVSVVWKDLSGHVAVFTCSSSKQLFKTQTCGKLIWERKKKKHSSTETCSLLYQYILAQVKEHEIRTFPIYQCCNFNE